jgi:hypothetical protein
MKKHKHMKTKIALLGLLLASASVSAHAGVSVTWPPYDHFSEQNAKVHSEVAAWHKTCDGKAVSTDPEHDACYMKRFKVSGDLGVYLAAINDAGCTEYLRSEIKWALHELEYLGRTDSACADKTGKQVKE